MAHACHTVFTFVCKGMGFATAYHCIRVQRRYQYIATTSQVKLVFLFLFFEIIVGSTLGPVDEPDSSGRTALVSKNVINMSIWPLYVKPLTDVCSNG